MAIQVVFEAVDKAALATLQKVAKGVDGVTEAEKRNKEQTGVAGQVWNNLVGGMTAANLISGTITKTFQFLIQQLKESVIAAQESELAMARTEATLLSTGRAAEISGQALASISLELSKGTMFDDEAILEAMNALSRFDSVATEQLPAVTSAAMDMAAALGTDVVSAAGQLGGALETGVIPKAWKFDAATKASIQSLISEGKESEALAVILENLGDKFEGQAEIMGETTAGGAAQAKNALSNLKEEIGAGMLPMLNELYASTIKAANGWLELAKNHNMERDIAEETNTVLEQSGLMTNQMAYDMIEAGKSIEGLSVATDAQNDAAREMARVQLYGAEAMRKGETTAADLTEKIATLGKTLGMTPEQVQATVDIVINGKEELEQVQSQILSFGNQDRLNFILDFQSQSDNFEKSKAEILDKMRALKDEILAAQASGNLEVLPGMREDMDALSDELNQNAEDFKRWQKQAVFAMIQTKLAADGLTDAEFGQLLGIGQDMGLLDEGVVAQAQGLMDTLSGVDTGSLDKAVQDVQYLIQQDGRTIKIYVEQTVTDVPSGGTMPTTGMASTSSGGDTFINYGPQYFYGTTLSGILAEWR